MTKTIEGRCGKCGLVKADQEKVYTDTGIPIIRNKKYRVAKVSEPKQVFMDELNKYILDHKELHDHLSWYILEHKTEHAKLNFSLSVIRWTIIMIAIYLLLIRIF